MYCYYKQSVALPHGAVGWSAVCDCGISWSYSLTFWKLPWRIVQDKRQNEAGQNGQFLPHEEMGDQREQNAEKSWFQHIKALFIHFMKSCGLNLRHNKSF